MMYDEYDDASMFQSTCFIYTKKFVQTNLLLSHAKFLLTPEIQALEAFY